MGSTDEIKTTAGNLNVGKVSLSNIAKDAYAAIANVTDIRSQIMAQITSVATGSGDKEIDIGALTDKGGTSVKIDISTGAGALVLDDALQELSTLEQAAAQLVAAENKAQKQVHSVTGQG
ncbi:hypothetical protein NO1_1080 [Candidatus Termititenax aidoneus]|uniref:Uncharacterized protein n=1 Tax=Termititenax aidoneus TaxID=2218524 RepID=A0A388TBW8_TERA1|nr:hypothetical protein NO1_1080 [Candidatus Termititenax aidoneus]